MKLLQNNLQTRASAGMVASAVAATLTMPTAAFAATAWDTTGNDHVSGTDTPCFMVQSQWSNAEGPQPTCSKGRFHIADADRPGSISARQGDDPVKAVKGLKAVKEPSCFVVRPRWSNAEGQRPRFPKVLSSSASDTAETFRYTLDPRIPDFGP